MDAQIQQLALERGVPAAALRRALASGDVLLVADLLGLERSDLELRLDALARAGVGGRRAAEAVALGA